MTRKKRLYLGAVLIGALYVVPACFREAPPCDQATRERIKATCKTEAECLERINERERICEERMRRGE